MQLLNPEQLSMCSCFLREHQLSWNKKKMYSSAKIITKQVNACLGG